MSFSMKIGRGKSIPLVLAHVIFLLHKLQVGLRQKSEGKRSQALESEVMKEEMEQYIGLESPASSAVVLLTTQNAVPLHAEIPS